MPRNGGWIPPSARTRQQMMATGEFHEQIQTWSEVSQESVDEPDTVILPQLEIEVNGELLPRLHQVTGSCVGVGGAHSYTMAMVGDVYLRQESEEVKLPFPFATYGVGRSYQWNSRGEGSFGSLQARACKPNEFGYLDSADPNVPAPTIRDGWAKWTKEQELAWSHPSGWPKPLEELKETASQFGIHNVTQITNTGELTQALAQGYGITVASMLGWRSSQVVGELAIATWSDQWAHQMAIDCYTQANNKKYYWMQNSWNKSPSLHKPCPTMSKFGVNGGAWLEESTIAKVLASRDAECYAHTATGGFPSKEFDWSNLLWDFGTEW